MEKWPLGVFASVDAGLGVKLEVAHELGVPTIQLHTPAKQTRTEENARRFLAELENLGMTISCVFGGFSDESYSDIPTTKESVGLVPPSTRAARVQELKEISNFTRLLGVDVVGVHIGFVPHDKSNDLYHDVVRVTQVVCDHCQKNGQALHLETGQEAAETLLRFIGDVDRENLFVNFDPANMILYGSGEPLEALRQIGSYVRSVHCKDALWSDKPGETWGQEVPLGQGSVGMEDYLRTLDEIGYTGPLTIEREIPQEPERQKEEIGGALDLLKSLKTKLGVSTV